jgi:anion transporter
MAREIIMSGSKILKATGYDKYIDWKIFVFPLAILLVVLITPSTRGMRDVGTEYALGEKIVVARVAECLFQKPAHELDQWQLLTVRMMDKSMRMGSTTRKSFLSRDMKWCRKKGIRVDKNNFEKTRQFISDMEEQTYKNLIVLAAAVRSTPVNHDELSDEDKELADKGAWKLKVALAMMVFTVICFVTGCIPLPAVAFCIGLLLVFSGVVTRTQVASLYWSDACWFIMGSLMFAAAFVKTGVDRRICLLLFSKLSKPSVGAITLVMIVVIAPLAAFISDHALAAIFLPIAIILHRGGQISGKPLDMELGKMLVITVAMACNIGGFGSPSGGARNVIMMSYLNDMCGMDIGYLTWVTYAMPFVIIMIPLTWLLIQWRFKPKTRDLSPAMTFLREDIAKMGKWNSKQIIAVIIFIVMVWFWFTEKAFFNMGIYPVRLGIGVVAVGGAMAYILTGVVNWRDYQEKVDWGVIWLYAGAIIFGKVLDETGAAHYIACTAIDSLSPLGFDQGMPMIAIASVLTSSLTQIMADGPAAASVGPITLNMVGITHPGSAMLPFMAMATAASSSFAYCLVIGTPPNAIVYASGYLEPKDYLRVGIPLWLIANIVLLLLIKLYWMTRGFSGLPTF